MNRDDRDILISGIGRTAGAMLAASLFMRPPPPTRRESRIQKTLRSRVASDRVKKQHRIKGVRP